jgi:hypothetical protein
MSWLSSDWPRRLTGDQLGLQRAAVALGGPEEPATVLAVPPSSCDWDIDHAKDLLADSRISYSSAQSLARTYVSLRRPGSR